MSHREGAVRRPQSRTSRFEKVDRLSPADHPTQRDPLRPAWTGLRADPLAEESLPRGARTVQQEQIEYRLPEFLPTQQKFRDIIEAGHPNGPGYILTAAYVGGWGSGKSTVAKWIAFDFAVCFPGIKVLIVRKTLASLESTTKEEFLHRMVEGDPEERNMTDVLQQDWNEKKQTYTMVNGSKVYFGGLDKAAKWSSSQFGLIVIEEASECEKRDITYLKSRLRQKPPRCPDCKGKRMITPCPECDGYGDLWGPSYRRAMILVSNHVWSEHWIYRDFVGTAEDPKIADYQIVETSSWENAPDRGGHLPQGYLESLCADEDETTVSVFVGGTWGVMPRGTPVFPHQPMVRGVPWHEQELAFDKDRALFWSIDFGYRFPFITFHQIGPRGQWRILAEYTVTKTQTATFLRSAIGYAQENFPGWHAPWICGDPAGWADRSEGPNDAQTVQEITGLPFRSIPSTADTARNRRRVIVARFEQSLGDQPSIVVDPRTCPRLCEALRGLYHYPDVRTASFVRSNYDETPVERHPHVDVAHTIEYFAANMWREEVTRGPVGYVPQVKVPVYNI